MVLKNIEHTTRKISFSTEENRSWTDEDEKLITAYLQLHDREQSLKTQANELLIKSGEINKQTNKVREALTTISAFIASVSKLADTFNLLNPNREIVKNIMDETMMVSDKIEEYQLLLNNMDIEVKKFSVINSAFNDELESEHLWDIYTDIKLSHFNNHEVNSIDIVSFDDEDNSFKEYMSFFERQNERAFKYGDDAIKDYNRLILETEKQYGIWAEYVKRYNLICELSKSLFPSAN